MKHKVSISNYSAECLENLKAKFTDRVYSRLGSQARGSIEVAFLRGYQSGYEDAILGKKAKYYVRTKKQLLKDGK